MSVGAVAERYAQALFELGSEAGQASDLATQIQDFAKSYQSSRQLQTTLENPLVKVEDRIRLVREVAIKVGVSELGIRSLIIMAKRGRLAAVTETAARLTRLCDEKEGILRAHVTVASEMPESYYQSLSAQLQSASGKKIVLERSVDRSLIGGAVANIGGRVLDASVRGSLSKFERDVQSALASYSH